MVRREEAGYTLVALAIAISILSILLAAALPVWKQVTQRQKEEELIFRGWQYAEAIRVFQQRHGRLPTRLDELIKVKPRSIRQLWKDPMTDSGEWGLVFQGQRNPQVGGTNLTQPGGLGQGDENDGRNGRNGSDGAGRPGRPGGNGQRQAVGPIVGVRSLSKDESIKILFGEQEYDRWTFTVDRLVQRQGNRLQVGVGPQVRAAFGIPSPRWIGRPFQEGLTPPGGGPGLADGTGPNGQPATGPDGRPIGGQGPNPIRPGGKPQNR